MTKSSDDLRGEYFALLRERADLQAACIAEWATMSHQVAKARNGRLLEIPNELAKLKRAAHRRHMVWPPEEVHEAS